MPENLTAIPHRKSGVRMSDVWSDAGKGAEDRSSAPSVRYGET
jgi:hypothetical protein